MKTRIFYLTLVAVLLLLWQYCGTHSQTVRLLISTPSSVLKYLRDHFVSLFTAVGITFFETVAGLSIAIIFSSIIMVICFYRPKLLKLILPLMVTSQVIPLIVLAPFFIMVFGIGLGSKIAMAALISFFPVFVNFYQGYKSIPETLHDLMKVYRASTKFRILNLYVPLAMPNILAGIKISANLAFIGAIVGEFSGTESGLGKNLYLSVIRLEPELMMASLALSVMVGGFLYLIITKIESNVTRWT